MSDRTGDARETGATEIPLAILFADLGGSTRLYDTLGDVEAHRIAVKCVGRIAAEVSRYDGTVIKTIGDEVMSTFASSDRASEAACAIQRAMTATDSPDAPRLSVHVGFHFGLVLPDAGDVFGDAVNVAARIVNLARAGEILTTRQTVDAMTPAVRSQTRQVDRRLVKGKQEELEIFELIWQIADLTALTPVQQREPRALRGRLVLLFGDQECEVSSASPSVTIGRAPENDLVVSDDRASRLHARIEMRQGKFVLYDQSTNGTLVHVQEGQPILLCREELILPESGSIAIGEYQETREDRPIRFRYEPPG